MAREVSALAIEDWWSFAGLWDKAETAEGPLESFAIITTEAGEDSRAPPNRQPVIFREGRLRPMAGPVGGCNRPADSIAARDAEHRADVRGLRPLP
ncbi:MULTISPECIES: SOS response-associated peptidase family protein [Acidiphilium]|uniref:SOS response-associated peptidase family protein n=1 Tax=Acidiphilium TaxID=522 RepID=UPI0038B3F228